MTTTQERLRHHAATLRTNSMPLKDLIPLLQQAADELDRAQRGEPVACLPEGWRIAAQDDLFKTITLVAPNGYSAVTTSVARNPENVLRMLAQDLLKTAHIEAQDAEIERLRADAGRYRWLAKYLVSDDESHDDAIVAATTVAELDYVIDAARKGTP